MTKLRKNYRDFTVAERDRFVQALFQVKASGIVDQFADMHARHFTHGIHVSSHFLPWHREILLRFERELQQHHPDVTIPYWDSTVDRTRSAPLWADSFLGQFDSAWQLRRVFGGATLPSAQQVEANQRRTTYDTFWPELENAIHNPPHVWVGGVMGSWTSPGDPVFYLHHCWIDFLWARWRRAYPNAPFVTSGAGRGLNDPLMEWPDRTPAHVLDHRSLGYSYWTPPSGPPAQGNDMLPGEVLTPGATIMSPNGRYTFVYQGDGNLVLYRSGTWVWDSATDGRAGVCIMQGDGNLVIYGPDAEYVWDTATDGQPGSRLVLQDDGNVVIYRPDGAAIWSTDTWVPTGPSAQGDDMQPGELLNPGESITSANGRYTLVYQGDGNLVLYRLGTWLWDSATDGRRAGVCIMQGDGNLVVYGPGGAYVWDTSTHENPGSRLVLQIDGNVVIYRPDGTPVWATNTVQLALVPNALALPRAQAEAAVRAADLVPNFTGSGDPGARVVNQAPRAGNRVPVGSLVMLELSTAEFVAVPDVVGLGRWEASEAITSAGLVPVFSGRGFEVASQTPAAGTQVSRGTRVTLRLVQAWE
jgi:tyrosinase